MTKQVNVRLDDALSAALEERAEKARMPVTDYVRALIADDINEQRNRFVTAGAYYMDLLTEDFQEVFGTYPTGRRNAA